MTDPDEPGTTGSLARHTDYGQTPLLEADIDRDPIAQFSRWLSEAELAGVYEPNAMVLSTIDADRRPSSRTVLLRTVDENGFEFFTNYESAKGQALMVNPDVSVVFPWYLIHRQVIVHGTAVPTSAEVSDAYFASRPHGSQVAAVASEQSRAIASRDILEQRVRELEEQYADAEVPRPANWGGFRITPRYFEFWQGRSSRMHDRLVFTRAPGGGWSLERLQP
jgi:pyridoxamine 5'-phosphate oxidase